MSTTLPTIRPLMSLEDFIDQVVDILDNDPEVREIQVDNVKLLCCPEARGDYAKTVAMICTVDPQVK